MSATPSPNGCADGASCDLGAGWARLTLRWSLRLQLVVTAAGRANVVTRAQRAAPRTDAGRTGYLHHRRPAGPPVGRAAAGARVGAGGGASLGAVQDQLVSRLAAAIEPPLAQYVAYPVAHHTMQLATVSDDTMVNLTLHAGAVPRRARCSSSATAISR
jgi:hypothetical protein